MMLSYKDKNYKIELNDNQAIIDGKVFAYQITEYNENVYKIRIGEDEKSVYIAISGETAYVSIDGEQFTFEKVDEELIHQRTEFTYEGRVDIIKPPMPGSIVKVLVERGQEVGEGDPLIIVEAMKMEITLYSSIAGKVVEVNVVEGQQVDSDKTLVVVQAE